MPIGEEDVKTTETGDTTPPDVGLEGELETNVEESVSDMLAEVPPEESATPGGDTKPKEDTKPKSEEKPKEEEAKVVLKPPAKKEATPKEQDMIKVGDAEYSREAIAKDPSLLDKVIQSARQFSTAQKKEADLLERISKLEQAREQAPTERGPAQPAITPEVLSANMAKAIDQHVESGFVEADYAKLFPMKSAVDAYNHQRIDRLVNMVVEMSEGREQQATTQNNEALYAETMENLGSLYTELAAQEAFSALSEKDVQEAFTNFLGNEIDIPLDRINIPNLERLYRAWCSESYDEAFRVKDEEIAALKSRGFLMSEGPTPRVGPSAENGPRTMADDVLDLVTD